MSSLHKVIADAHFDTTYAVMQNDLVQIEITDLVQNDKIVSQISPRLICPRCMSWPLTFFKKLTVAMFKYRIDFLFPWQKNIIHRNIFYGLLIYDVLILIEKICIVERTICGI